MRGHGTLPAAQRLASASCGAQPSPNWGLHTGTPRRGIQSEDRRQPPDASVVPASQPHGAPSRPPEPLSPSARQNHPRGGFLRQRRPGLAVPSARGLRPSPLLTPVVPAQPQGRQSQQSSGMVRLGPGMQGRPGPQSLQQQLLKRRKLQSARDPGLGAPRGPWRPLQGSPIPDKPGEIHRHLSLYCTLQTLHFHQHRGKTLPRQKD